MKTFLLKEFAESQLYRDKSSKKSISSMSEAFEDLKESLSDVLAEHETNFDCEDLARLRRANEHQATVLESIFSRKKDEMMALAR